MGLPTLRPTNLGARPSLESLEKMGSAREEEKRSRSKGGVVVNEEAKVKNGRE